MTGLVLAGLAAALLLAFGVSWWGMIQRVELGERRWQLNAMMAAAMVLAGASFIVSPGPIGVGVGSVLAGLTLLLGATYFGLLALAGQSKQPMAVAVGSPLLDFKALDANGEPFQLSSLEGRPVLLKFFRGHW